MRIFLLQRYIKRRHYRTFKTERLHNRKLVVDGRIIKDLYIAVSRPVSSSSSSLDRLRRTLNGDYKQLAKVTKRFLQKLRRCNLDVVFVFPGLAPINKSKLCEKNEWSIQRIDQVFRDSRTAEFVPPITPLMQDVIVKKILRDEGVEFVVTDVDEVLEVVTLANSLNCPVIAADSEYFCYRLNAGLGYYHSQLFDNLLKDEDFISMKMIYTDSLIKELAVTSHFDLALLGAILTVEKGTRIPGDQPETERQVSTNERYMYIERTITHIRSAVRERLSEEQRMETVGDKLGFSPEEKLELDQYITRFLHADDNILSEYLQKGKLESRLTRFNGKEWPKWMIEDWRRGLLPTDVANAFSYDVVRFSYQFEDMEQESARNCSLKIRKVIYGILRQLEEDEENDVKAKDVDPAALEVNGVTITVAKVNDAVDDTATETSVKINDVIDNPASVPHATGNDVIVEVDHFQRKHKETPIIPIRELSGFGIIPNVNDIPKMSSQDKRRLFFITLECDQDSFKFLENTCPKGFVFFFAVTKFWWKNTINTKKQDLDAILAFAFRNIITETDKFNREILQKLTAEPIDADGITWKRQASVQHVFCQWQACYLDGVNLNRLLQSPLVEPAAGLCYDDEFIFAWSQGTRNLAALIRDEADHDLREVYQLVYELITGEKPSCE